MRGNSISGLINRKDYDAVEGEVLHLFAHLVGEFEVGRFVSAYRFVVSLFEGDDPRYQACNTEYHDLTHTVDTCLATARLLHGALLNGRKISPAGITNTLMAALFHDIGFLQETGDAGGTGAKYTKIHVQRGIDLVGRHARELGLDTDTAASLERLLLSTDLAVPVTSIPFASEEEAFLGDILAAADLMAQMADPAYLEKLLFLYHEMVEGGVDLFESAVDLVRKTVHFFDFVDQRLARVNDLVESFFVLHFSDRWGIDANLYRMEIERHKNYLNQILTMDPDEPHKYLRREGIFERHTSAVRH